MSTRRGFLSSIAAVAAVIVGGVSFGGAKQVVRQKTRITLSHWIGESYPAPLAVRCTAKTRREMVKFVRGLRDVVWPPGVRITTSLQGQRMYVDAYNNVEVNHIYRDSAGCWYIDTAPGFLEHPLTLVEDLATYDIELVDDCGGKIVRRLSRRTKHGVTRTREVIKTSI
jgi:hypothetical protein